MAWDISHWCKANMRLSCPRELSERRQLQRICHWNIQISQTLTKIICSPKWLRCHSSSQVTDVGNVNNIPHNATFHWNFQKYSLKVLLCYHWLSVSGNSEMRHCGISLTWPISMDWNTKFVYKQTIVDASCRYTVVGVWKQLLK